MTLASKALVALAVCSVTALAQSAEDRFKAKYGRNTPAEEKRLSQEKASTAYRDATPPQGETKPTDKWAEQRHRAKLGRATPAEEAKINAEKANTAYREVKTPPADRWQESYFETKYGRSAPSKK